MSYLPVKIINLSVFVAGVVVCLSIKTATSEKANLELPSLLSCFKDSYKLRSIKSLDALKNAVTFRLVPSQNFKCRNGEEAVDIFGTLLGAYNVSSQQYTFTAFTSFSSVSNFRTLPTDLSEDGLLTTDFQLFQSGIFRHFTKDGMFAVNNNDFTNIHYYYPDEFCVASNRTGDVDYFKIKLCSPRCTPSSPCIQKCCPLGMSFNVGLKGCKPSNVSLSSEISKNEKDTILKPHFIHSSFNCPQWKMDNITSYQAWFSRDVPPMKKKSFKPGYDGKVLVIDAQKKRRWVPFKDEGCIDIMENYSQSEMQSNSINDQIFLSCPVTTNCQSPVSTWYIILMYISSLFLLLTCINYLLLWSQQNIHGWTVFSFIVSTLFMLIFTATGQLLGHLSTPQYTYRNTKICIVNGILAHFFFLSTFTWLTTINFDLYLTFRYLTTMSAKEKSLKKFLFYMVFACGLPTVVVATAVLLDINYPDKESLITVPEYGNVSCYIAPYAQGVFQYYIVACLLTVNIPLIILTFFHLYAAKKSTLKVNSQKDSNQTYLIVGKLFVVMGITWIFEVVSWALTKEDEDQEWYWYFSDVYNFFQAFLIFVIFVCKKSTVVQLKQKYPLFKKIFELKKSQGEQLPLTSTTNTKSSE